MRTFGLIGFPLSHSLSPQLFQERFEKEQIADATYRLFPLEKISGFRKLLTDIPDLAGLNVTIPYKQDIIPFLNELDPDAKSINAVNTIKIIRSKNSTYLKGYNTDIIGFEKAIHTVLPDYKGKALVLGNGGASKSICHVLQKMNIPYAVVSRTPSAGCVSYDEANLNLLAGSHLIINTTPLGNYPAVNTYPVIHYEKLTADHFLFDLVYNPAETLFMKKGIQYGASVCNGYAMLEQQADASWQIWNSD